MKGHFRDYAKEGELSFQVAQRFAKESTKEDFEHDYSELIGEVEQFIKGVEK